MFYYTILYYNDKKEEGKKKKKKKKKKKLIVTMIANRLEYDAIVWSTTTTKSKRKVENTNSRNTDGA